MTDKEIIKAFECCVADDYDYCKECPFRGNGCDFALIKAAYGLINRQKSKIERLEMDKEQLERDVSNALCNLGELELHYAYARAEAIKEFAEKLKERYSQYSHLHKQADEAINDIRYPDFEMISVWNVMDLCDSEIATYETMGDLQENIEVIAKSSLLSEFEKDLDSIIKEVVGEDNET